VLGSALELALTERGGGVTGRIRTSSRAQAKAPMDLRSAGSKFIVIGPLFAVVGGRWGSYLGIPGTPLYFADLSVAVGILLVLTSAADPRSRIGRLQTHFPRVGWISFGFFVLALIMGIVASPGLSIYAIRDALPFIYLLLLPVFYRAVEDLGRERVFLWLRNAAILHLIWFAASSFHILPEIAIPFGGTPVFSTRGDFDSLICGVSAVVLALDTRIRASLRLMLLIVTAVASLLQGSRAGLLSACLIALCVILIQRPFADRDRGLRRFGLAALGTIPIAFVALLLSQDVPAWAMGFAKLIPNDSQAYQSGQNTWNARVDAWALIVQYSIDNGRAYWTGFGFGSNTISDSGAVQYLSGSADVRAAHNFVVTWFAVLGIIGVIAVLIAFALLLGLAVKRSFRARGINGIGLGLMIGIISAASGGVILESPFGYMTFVLAIAIAVQPLSPKSSSSLDVAFASRRQPLLRIMS
jgi:hypothetical protein